ncbi:2,3,4,5-tetrahydropyridine-2,6-dicarboxylate N-succinyltransferase [Rothia dentocariosa]|uniref:2,3,4,5-tetrahydropyridine-2,6-dicarboxylate N-succinyltransferase n=1 Tax=Rothia dentocariosa TaxID=2047 RepID=UPI0010722084|nr:2,3,4,5-tetrahydropyridine-2,6-dicarboxylate N-succinyltransferase [Rothia dentocariosa]TFI36358.1 2,3,4,5-tetrahydropyridine-2,6-dicarboxylate N-succinyltransferase [Rothia dentocariosa]
MVGMSENLSSSESRYASGVALVNVVAAGNEAGTVLDAWFPAPALTQTPDLSLADELDALVADHPERNARTEVRTASINLDEAPEDAVDAYLRLHLLSHTLVRPNSINLDGLFGKLANVAWTNHGPVLASEFQKLALGLRKLGYLSVSHIDKFPRLVDYVVPAGVRVGDGDRLRLGAHLSPGTTVMHEGFVNFNAGTLGTSMVEGRISQGVVVGDGSDVGGGASTMGTLSGGGTQRVSIGERSLLGAESGIGIALGDDCVVEAGLYVTAGSRVSVLIPGEEPRVVKAAELSGVSNLLFRRNSVSGAIEVLPRAKNTVELNDALHLN